MEKAIIYQKSFLGFFVFIYDANLNSDKKIQLILKPDLY